MSDDVDTRACLTKAQAAQILGTSTKGIERAVAAGDLVQHWRRQPGTPDVAVYFPDEVAALATKRAAARRRGPSGGVLVRGQPEIRANGNGHGSLNLHLADASSALTPIQTGVDPDPLRAFALAVVAAVMSQTSETSQTQTTWIEIPEAAAILGRSQAYVRRQIKAGVLHAERDRTVVVRKADVEAL